MVHCPLTPTHFSAVRSSHSGALTDLPRTLVRIHPASALAIKACPCSSGTLVLSASRLPFSKQFARHMMLKLLSILAFLAIASTICSAIGDNSWPELGALTHTEAEEIAHFFETGKMPSEGASPPPKRLRSDVTVSPHHQASSSEQSEAATSRNRSPSQNSQTRAPHFDEDSTSDRALLKTSPMGHSAVTAPEFWVPPQLSSGERIAILQEIAPMFKSGRSAALPQVHPYEGQALTSELLQDAFIYRSGFLRQHESGYFLVPKFKRGRVHVWQRFNMKESGSFFRYIGWIESPFNFDTRIRSLPPYQTSRYGLRPFGTDTVADFSELRPVSRKAD